MRQLPALLRQPGRCNCIVRDAGAAVCGHCKKPFYPVRHVEVAGDGHWRDPIVLAIAWFAIGFTTAIMFTAFLHSYLHRVLQP